jgi:hypothetical protein
MIISIVLAILLVMQIFITIWLYPQPWRILGKHEHLSAEEVCEAADALEQEFLIESLKTRDLLLNISYDKDYLCSKREKNYLEEHSEKEADNLIIFRCTLYTRFTGGAIELYIAMERDAQGEWQYIGIQNYP